MKLCIECGERPATKPRNYVGTGRKAKELCTSCYGEFLRAQLRDLYVKSLKLHGADIVTYETTKYDP